MHLLHDMLRIPIPREYPAHFFNRIRRFQKRVSVRNCLKNHLFRLYDKLQLAASIQINNSLDESFPSPEGKDEAPCFPLAKDLADEEFDQLETAQEFPSIAELTKNLENLTDQDSLESIEIIERFEHEEKDMIVSESPISDEQESTENLGTIRELQGEIDKLLAPLAKTPVREESDDESESSSNPFSLCENQEPTQIVIENATVSKQKRKKSVSVREIHL